KWGSKGLETTVLGKVPNRPTRSSQIAMRPEGGIADCRARFQPSLKSHATLVRISHRVSRAFTGRGYMLKSHATLLGIFHALKGEGPQFVRNVRKLASLVFLVSIFRTLPTG